MAAYLRRIERVNPQIHAVVQPDPERARRAALAADEAVARGESLGPLHGVPFSVKDWIETEGLICAAGFESRREFVPRRDATVVARLRSAGAILLGKTNVGDGSPAYLRPENPHRLGRTPGHSSSGEAALIAAGGSPVGLASDSGGSIRFPAHCCGVAGLKPTRGLVPSTGHFPRIGALSDPRTTIGPLARRVEDLAVTLRVIAGPDGRDPSVVPVSLGDPAAVDVATLRVAWFTHMGGATPTSETAAAVQGAARALAACGARVEEMRPPCIDESLPITLTHWQRTASLSLRDWLPDRTSALTADAIERSTFAWERFQRSMLEFMQGYDVILAPTAATPAPAHRPLAPEDFIYMLPYSLTGQPVAVVRCATSPEGLPIGVQVAGGVYRDDVALAVAARLEASFGGWPPAAEALP